MVQLADPAPWGRSTVRAAEMVALVADGLLPPNTDASRPAWIAPTPEERDPKPPSRYVLSLAWLHERGFGIPTGRFIRALCHHY